MDIVQLMITIFAVLGIATVVVVAVVPTLLEMPAAGHHRGRRQPGPSSPGR
ncbi:MAG: hypothetical protein ACR2LI_09370 [Propionibacteriaceae bacterium]